MKIKNWKKFNEEHVQDLMSYDTGLSRIDKERTKNIDVPKTDNKNDWKEIFNSILKKAKEKKLDAMVVFQLFGIIFEKNKDVIDENDWKEIIEKIKKLPNFPL